jgi:hypothetical protein
LIAAEKEAFDLRNWTTIGDALAKVLDRLDAQKIERDRPKVGWTDPAAPCRIYRFRRKTDAPANRRK